jgi:hypothetical protein
VRELSSGRAALSNLQNVAALCELVTCAAVFKKNWAELSKCAQSEFLDKNRMAALLEDVARPFRNIPRNGAQAKELMEEAEGVDPALLLAVDGPFMALGPVIEGLETACDRLEHPRLTIFKIAAQVTMKLQQVYTPEMMNTESFLETLKALLLDFKVLGCIGIFEPSVESIRESLRYRAGLRSSAHSRIPTLRNLGRDVASLQRMIARFDDLPLANNHLERFFSKVRLHTGKDRPKLTGKVLASEMLVHGNEMLFDSLVASLDRS